MKNPFDLYNDNRAYMGFIRGLKEARKVAKEVKSLEEFIERTDIDDDRFRHLLDEE